MLKCHWRPCFQDCCQPSESDGARRHSLQQMGLSSNSLPRCEQTGLRGQQTQSEDPDQADVHATEIPGQSVAQNRPCRGAKLLTSITTWGPQAWALSTEIRWCRRLLPAFPAPGGGASHTLLQPLWWDTRAPAPAGPGGYRPLDSVSPSKELKTRVTRWAGGGSCQSIAVASPLTFFSSIPRFPWCGGCFGLTPVFWGSPGSVSFSDGC